MADIGARSAAMTQTLAELRGLWSQVASKVGLSQDGADVVLFDANGNRLGRGDVEAIETSLNVARQSIGLLEGRITSERFGNLRVSAEANDDAFRLWCDLAKSCGDSLSVALGLGAFNIEKFFVSVYDGAKEIVATVASDASDAFPFVVIGLVAIALIVIFK